MAVAHTIADDMTVGFIIGNVLVMICVIHDVICIYCVQM